jgi:hypothetical protein
MKTIVLWLTALLSSWAASCMAQVELAPKEEYKLISSATALTVSRGTQDSVKLTVIRSRSFKTGKASMNVNAPTNAGLDVRVKQISVESDEFMVYLITTTDTKPGEYTFIPTCTLRNKQKGIILKLTIN